jgi:hypothetical protein
VGYKADFSPPSVAEVKNVGSYISIPPYFFIVCCLMKDRDVYLHLAL